MCTLAKIFGVFISGLKEWEILIWDWNIYWYVFVNTLLNIPLNQKLQNVAKWILV